MSMYVDMHGWEILAKRFSAPLRDGFHYFGRYAGADYAGPHNTAQEAWEAIERIRAEIRPGVLDFHANWERMEDAKREVERASILATARELDSATLDAEACAAGPGRYEGASDLALVVALDILSGHGCADDQAGSTEYGLHLARFGRYVLAGDGQGFVYVETYDDESAAQAELDAENARQSTDDE
jgi:hypothetical protein